MNRFLSAIIMIFLYLTSLCLAEQRYLPMKDTSAFKTKLETATKSVNSIKSDFVQEKNLSALSEKIISKGKFYFKKNNLLRWEYVKPFKYLIVFNDTRITIKDEGKVSQFDMKSSELFGKVNDIILRSIRGDVLRNKDFSYQFFESEKYFQLRMFPLQKSIKVLFRQINISFDKKDYSVSRLELIEPSGDFTKIDFSGKKFNETIPEEIFIIK